MPGLVQDEVKPIVPADEHGEHADERPTEVG